MTKKFKQYRAIYDPDVSDIWPPEGWPPEVIEHFNRLGETDHKTVCNELTGGPQFGCTREPGHKGPHVAGIDPAAGVSFCAVWD